MGASFGDRFWEYVCPYRSVWFALLGIQGMFAALLAFSLAFVPPDPHTRAIIVVTFGLVAAVFAAAAYVLYRCTARKRKRRQFGR